MEVKEPDIETSSKVDEAVKALMSRNIILYNDEVNAFGHVIGCLTEYCQHSLLQAEQCAMIVHNNGKCAVKQGSYEDLKPICEALNHHGLTAEIQ